MKNFLKFHGDHYTMRINGKEARLDLDKNLINKEDFSEAEKILIQWAVV